MFIPRVFVTVFFAVQVRATCHGISAASGKLGAATGIILLFVSITSIVYVDFFISITSCIILLETTEIDNTHANLK